MAAERETVDRLIAAHLADQIGARFSARISGVTRSGLFVRLLETGADGFVPAATLGPDYFAYDEAAHSLTSKRSGQSYRLADVDRGSAGRGGAHRRRAAVRNRGDGGRRPTGQTERRARETGAARVETAAAGAMNARRTGADPS